MDVTTAAPARCSWCGDDAVYVAYHDTEWGRPLVDDRALFEKLCLEGFQAGLSWLTILRKRPGFRRAFGDFDPIAVARFAERDIERLLADPGIVRHRGKIDATINNARRLLELLEREGSFASFIWRFEPRSAPSDPSTIPTTCPEATGLARELKRRGWKFVGPTTVYSLFQSAGLVNDHAAPCFARAEVAADRAALVRPR
ncbi:MAG: DNA-3-methyladenine glycosylase I [Acidimicrobiales bacterium]